MAANGAPDRQEGVYGPGTYADTSFTPMPQECHRLLLELAAKTTGFTKDKELLNGVTFVGQDLPCIPGPIKSPAMTAVLHAMAGIIGHEILELRGVKTDRKTTVSTDQAGLFLGTPVLTWIDGQDGPELLKNPGVKDLSQGKLGTYTLLRSQAIYPTATPDTWYQLHGSTNPYGVLRAINIEPDDHAKLSGDEAYELIKKETVKYSARDLELMMMEKGFAGTPVFSPAGWLETLTGRVLASHPLINYRMAPLSGITNKKAPSFSAISDDKRPLAGVKVLELARIIAAPVCGSVLASMGAEVIRVQTDRLIDFVPSEISGLMAGKQCYNLDITIDDDRAKLHQLMDDADVVIQGYRLKSLERRGYGLDVALELAAKRGKGIVYIDENCYGPDGYYAERPGWQQIADACAGSSYVVGKAFGKGPILPCLPISDMSTGMLATVAVMSMLRDREKYGGSYHGTAALAAYNAATLQPWVGLYQPQTVQAIQEKFGFRPWGPQHHVIELYNQIFEDWKAAGEKGGNLTTNDDFYVHFDNSVYGKDMRVLAPIVRYTDKASTPRWSSPPAPFCQFPMSKAKWVSK